MIWFILAAVILLMAALLFLSRPFWGFGTPDRGLADSEIYRRQAAEIDIDVRAGTLSPEEAETTRNEILRRLLAAADREMAEDATALTPARGSRKWLFGFIAVFMIIGSAALYSVEGQPGAFFFAANQIASGPSPHDMEELTRDVALLRDRLKQDPTNAQGWMLMGRTLATLRRFEESKAAYRQAIRFDPANARLHAQLGEVLTIEAGDVVTPEAKAEFTQGGNDPRARYYLALAAAQNGNLALARQGLQDLLKEAPADAPWRSVVAARLAQLGDSGTQLASPAAGAPDLSGSSGGPTQADVVAAEKMSPEQRQAMIRGMVDRLAQRMEQNPNDQAGWEKLARAYEVLGETEKAKAARQRAGAAATPQPAADEQLQRLEAATSANPADAANWLALARHQRALGRLQDAEITLRQANERIPANLPLLQAFGEALASHITDENVPDELLRVMSQINALDPRQTDALWYLGLSAARRGDSHRAEHFWRALVANLPADDPQRAIVSRRIEALR